MFLKFIVFILILTSLNSLKSAVISGNLTEENSGEVIIGASVAIHKFTDLEDTTKVTIINNKKIESTPSKGAFSNQYGFYSISNITEGKYAVIVRSIGYEIYFKEIEVKQENLRINIELQISRLTTGEVQVFADKDFSPTAKISSVEISPTMISKLPQFGSEVDVFRTLQLLPGVASASEISSGLYVRGGSPDQNLVLLDEVIIYNPSHMAGFLSTFNSDALRDIKLIKGAFPAEYGGRLSSVIDMYMNEGTKEKISGKGGVSLISSKLTLEGPITDKSTFMVSGRRFYFDGLMALLPADNMPNYYFYDLNGKVNYKIDENNTLYASTYLGRDVFNFKENYGFDKTNYENGINFNWGNKTFNIRWKHLFSPTLFTNFSLIYTNYNSQFKIWDKRFEEGKLLNEFSFSTLSEIEDFTLKGKAEYFGLDNHLIKFGVEATNHFFTSIASDIFIDDNLKDLIGERKISALDAAVFVQDEWNITDKFSTNIGARLYYFQQGDYLRAEPRLSFAYKLNDNITFVAAGAMAHQFLHLIIRNDITLPTDLWFPSTDKVLPQRSSQVVIGTHTKLGKDKSWTLNIEGYYKDMQNLLEFRDDALFTLGIPLENQFTSGFGWAYGGELFLEKKIGKFTGWVGYTLAYTKRKFEELNNGMPFFPRYDRRNDISIATTFEINKRWEIGAAWIYATGQAFTMPTGTYQGIDLDGRSDFLFGGGFSSFGDKYQYTQRNGARLPSYHRLDLNLMYKYKWFGLPWVASFNTYNVYNRLNPFSWYIQREYDYWNDTSKKKLKQITLFPIIPTVGLSFEF